MAGFNVLRSATKFLAKKYGSSIAKELGKEALKGAVAGTAEAAGDVVGAITGNKARKEISKNELQTQRDIERARLENQRFSTTIQALSNAKSPAALVATVVGAVTAPKKYRELSSQAIDSPNNSR